MSGRRFDVANTERPRGLERVIAIVPACFTPEQWTEYIEEHWRYLINNPSGRARLVRGEMPDFCTDCTQGYMRNMRALGRCHPQDSQIDLLTTGETA
jgi:hypothetical protein